MRHRDLIAAIARHLPHRTQRDVEEVIDVLIELMQDELVQGEEVSLPDIGKLSIEMQTGARIRRCKTPAWLGSAADHDTTLWAISARPIA